MGASGQDFAQVRVDERGPVRVVTIDRHDKRNALSIELRRGLASTLARLGTDPSVAAVVLTGAGTAFCAGMDLSQFGGDDANRRALLESSAGLFQALRTLPRPTIAAVNGPAIAGGFVLAAMCDLRVAGPEATFCMPEVSMGFASSWASVRRVLPDQLARRFIFTGETIDAATACAWGMVAEVADDPVDRALELAGQMAANPVRGLAETKRLMLEAEDPGLRAAAEAELRAFEASLFRPRSD